MPSPPLEYDNWAAGLTADTLRREFISRGTDYVIVKTLGPNNNSKQQIYLAPGLNDLRMIPMGPPVAHPGTSSKAHERASRIFACGLRYSWWTPDGDAPAPEAKLIYYPQYPEVRLSGLLRGSPSAPNHLLRIDRRGTEPGRVLLLGVSPSNAAILAVLVGSDTPVAKELATQPLEPAGSFRLWPLERSVQGDPWRQLADELLAVSRMGFVPGQRLGADGPAPYHAPNAGGYTLEALLGITSNALGGPDLLGYEVKQFRVSRLDAPGAKVITLMDVSPDHGIFARNDKVAFIKSHGRHNEAANRYDFNGRHFHNVRNSTTGATLKVLGYDGSSTPDTKGEILLESDTGLCLMSWSFARLLDHWRRKHAHAVYVPSISRTPGAPAVSGQIPRAFRFGRIVYRGEGTSFIRFLDAVLCGAVCIDPAINAKPVASGQWRAKVRTGFRISFPKLALLYDKFEEIDLEMP